LYRFCAVPAAYRATKVKRANLVVMNSRFLGPKIRTDPPETNINENIALHYWRISIPYPPIIADTRAHRQNGQGLAGSIILLFAIFRTFQPITGRSVITGQRVE
jgi:hypothetical protein